MASALSRPQLQTLNSKRYTQGGLLGKFSPAIPLSMDELRQKGINDIGRLTEPYIKPHLLEQVFRHDWRRVKDRYFTEVWGDVYRFQDGLNSEVELTKVVEREGSMLGYMDRKELLAGLRYTPQT